MIGCSLMNHYFLNGTDISKNTRFKYLLAKVLFKGVSLATILKGLANLIYSIRLLLGIRFSFTLLYFLSFDRPVKHRWQNNHIFIENLQRRPLRGVPK